MSKEIRGDTLVKMQEEERGRGEEVKKERGRGGEVKKETVARSAWIP